MKVPAKIGELIFAGYIGATLAAIAMTASSVGLLSFLKDYQTLLVGGPALLIVTLTIAAMRGEDRRHRDAQFAAYEPVFDALDEVDFILRHVSARSYPSAIAKLMGRRSSAEPMSMTMANTLADRRKDFPGLPGVLITGLAEAMREQAMMVSAIDGEMGELTAAEIERLERAHDYLTMLASELKELVDTKRINLAERLRIQTA